MGRKWKRVARKSRGIRDRIFKHLAQKGLEKWTVYDLKDLDYDPKQLSNSLYHAGASGLIKRTGGTRHGAVEWTWADMEPESIEVTDNVFKPKESVEITLTPAPDGEGWEEFTVGHQVLEIVRKQDKAIAHKDTQLKEANQNIADLIKERNRLRELLTDTQHKLNRATGGRVTTQELKEWNSRASV